MRVTAEININRGQFSTKVVTLTTFIIVTWVVLVNIAIRHWEKRQLLSIHARMLNINTIHKYNTIPNINTIRIRLLMKKTLKNCLIGECGQISWFGFTRGQQYLSVSTSIIQPSHRHYWHTAPHSPLVQGSSDVVHLAQHIFQHLLHPRLRAWSVWVEQNLRFPSSWDAKSSISKDYPYHNISDSRTIY